MNSAAAYHCDDGVSNRNIRGRILCLFRMDPNQHGSCENEKCDQRRVIVVAGRMAKPGRLPTERRCQRPGDVVTPDALRDVVCIGSYVRGSGNILAAVGRQI